MDGSRVFSIQDAYLSFRKDICSAEHIILRDAVVVQNDRTRSFSPVYRHGDGMLIFLMGLAFSLIEHHVVQTRETAAVVSVAGIQKCVRDYLGSRLKTWRQPRSMVSAEDAWTSRWVGDGKGICNIVNRRGRPELITRPYLPTMHAIKSSCLLALGLVAYTQAHGGHDQQPVVSPDADWATRHMAGK